MSGFLSTFKRVETKYLLDGYQYNELMKRLEDIARVDEYGKTSILNIYYDTPSWELIKTSLDKPVYKEKLRLRTYGIPEDDTNAFVEIKKKYDGIVYKRRMNMPYKKAFDYLLGECKSGQDSQISREIDAFLDFYAQLEPAMAISYDRIALKGIYDPDLRITFDTNIRWRTDDLSLKYGNIGKDILEKDQCLMELKIVGAVPLDLAHIFSEIGIYKVSFSKYGKGFEDYMYAGKTAGVTHRNDGNSAKSKAAIA